MFAFVIFAFILVIKVLTYDNFVCVNNASVPAKSVTSVLEMFVSGVPVMFDSLVLFFVETFEKSSIEHPATAAVVVARPIAKQTRASLVIAKLFRHDFSLASACRFKVAVQNYLVAKSLRCALTAGRTLIASNWRFYFANQLLLREEAATVLQAVSRGMFVRKHFQHKIQAATCIQAVSRGALSRKQLQLENQAATQLQASLRGSFIRKQLQSQTESATHLQAAIRGVLVRKQLQLQTEAATTLQALTRGLLIRRPLQLQLEALTTFLCNHRARAIQRGCREYLKRKQEEGANNTVIKRIHRFFLPLLQFGFKIVMATKWLLFLLQADIKTFGIKIVTAANPSFITTLPKTNQSTSNVFDIVAGEGEIARGLAVTAIIEDMYKAWTEKNAVTALRLPRSHPMRGALSNSQPKKLPVRRHRRERPVRYYIVIGPGQVICNRKRDDTEVEEAPANKKVRTT